MCGGGGGKLEREQVEGINVRFEGHRVLPWKSIFMRNVCTVPQFPKQFSVGDQMQKRNTGNMQLWTPPVSPGWGQCGVWNDGGRVWRVVRRRKDTLGKLRPHQWRFRLRSHHSGGHSGVIQSICFCFRRFYPPPFSLSLCVSVCVFQVCMFPQRNCGIP